MKTHTNGPWEFESILGSETSLRVFSDKCYVADVFFGAGMTQEDIYMPHANARLIAAAPELLEALTIVYEGYCEAPNADFDWDKWGEKAEAAITKAKGAE